RRRDSQLDRLRGREPCGRPTEPRCRDDEEWVVARRDHPHLVRDALERLLRTAEEASEGGRGGQRTGPETDEFDDATVAGIWLGCGGGGGGGGGEAPPAQPRRETTP